MREVALHNQRFDYDLFVVPFRSEQCNINLKLHIGQIQHPIPLDNPVARIFIGKFNGLHTETIVTHTQRDCVSFCRVTKSGISLPRCFPAVHSIFPVAYHNAHAGIRSHKIPDLTFPNIESIDLINPPVVSCVKLQGSGVIVVRFLVFTVTQQAGMRSSVGVVHIVKISAEIYIVFVSIRTLRPAKIRIRRHIRRMVSRIRFVSQPLAGQFHIVKIVNPAWTIATPIRLEDKTQIPKVVKVDLIENCRAIVCKGYRVVPIPGAPICSLAQQIPPLLPIGTIGVVDVSACLDYQMEFAIACKGAMQLIPPPPTAHPTRLPAA
ncbi:hypothetical protein ES703_117436 [subsurface metagenome]